MQVLSTKAQKVSQERKALHWWLPVLKVLLRQLVAQCALILHTHRWGKAITCADDKACVDNGCLPVLKQDSMSAFVKAVIHWAQMPDQTVTNAPGLLLI